MSRIGKQPVVIPAEVTVNITGNTVSMKSNKGELTYTYNDYVNVDHKDNEIQVSINDNELKSRELFGLTRTLINNMVVGLTTGFSKSLDINGIGYKAEVKSNKVIFSLGYSHPIYFYPPEGIEITAEGPTKVTVSGIDKELVGQVAAKVRSLRPPEPYKGKGIKYSDEQIIRKAGKTGK